MTKEEQKRHVVMLVRLLNARNSRNQLTALVVLNAYETELALKAAIECLRSEE